jgi:hypothetical protein
METPPAAAAGIQGARFARHPTNASENGGHWYSGFLGGVKGKFRIELNQF